MIKKLALTIPLLALCLLFGNAEAADYIYTPALTQPAESLPADGVLVREITISKGDTLSAISRRFTGRGNYYPQILLFNNIKNPNLIYTGDTLRIPVKHNAAPATTSKKPLSTPYNTDANQRVTVTYNQQQKKPAPEPAHMQTTSEHNAAGKQIKPEVQNTEQQLLAKIDQQIKAGNCRAALPLLDEFLDRYPNSTFAPEAALNRAECYMRIATP